ncbi:MAG: RluA family pseudouridine synthase [Clostridiales bacterium]|nr:RluA family pseudouridine synthase [Clostridiales bacterium]
MKQITITAAEAGQRLDKLLARYMRNAPKSFLYKMLRKKNITLNGKKAQGNELLQPGDLVKLFFSDETYEKFGGVSLSDAKSTAPLLKAGTPFSPQSGVAGLPQPGGPGTVVSGPEAQNPAGFVPELVPGVHPPSVLYKDDHILLFHKPAGILSQKAMPQDVSLVEYLNAYLLASGCMTREQMQMVRPSICNRLDRNTSGIVVSGISLAGLQTMNRLLKERSIRKYYRCIVCGRMRGEGILRGYLKKDGHTNTVTVSDIPSSGRRKIETGYRVLSETRDLTLLEVHLITGRSHQIRAHLAFIGHPLLGDRKYGDPGINRAYRDSYGLNCQLLHAYRLEFPQVDGALSYLSGKIFRDPVPELFGTIMNAKREL